MEQGVQIRAVTFLSIWLGELSGTGTCSAQRLDHPHIASVALPFQMKSWDCASKNGATSPWDTETQFYYLSGPVDFRRPLYRNDWTKVLPEPVCVIPVVLKMGLHALVGVLCVHTYTCVHPYMHSWVHVHGTYTSLMFLQFSRDVEAMALNFSVLFYLGCQRVSGG